ncbi:hypothetical protein IWX75_003436 [Arthrobacter sp. CAN_A6]
MKNGPETRVEIGSYSYRIQCKRLLIFRTNDFKNDKYSLVVDRENVSRWKIRLQHAPGFDKRP